MNSWDITTVKLHNVITYAEKEWQWETLVGCASS